MTAVLRGSALAALARLGLTAVLCVPVQAVLGPPLAYAQEPLPAARIDDVRALARAVYASLTEGVGAPPFTWSGDFFKGANGSTDVPFTITVDRARLPGEEAVLYLLATPHEAPVAVTDELPGRPSTLAPEELQGPPPPTVAFEAVYFVDVADMGTDPTAGVYRFSRAFSLRPGDYDVYVAMAPVSTSEGAVEERPAIVQDPIMVTRETVSVPDYWSTGLTTSSIVVLDRVEPVGQPLVDRRQVSDPYIMGGVRVVPAADTDFGPSERLSVAFFVYNGALAASGTPDVTVDYLLYQQLSEGARYHGRTRAQQFNAETLVGFDPEAGHQIVAAQAVPLGAFPAGRYRLDIRVMDNTSGASVVRSVDFGVGDP